MKRLNALIPLCLLTILYNRSKILLLGCVFFLHGLMSAQTSIQGVILDNETSEALIGANIIIQGTTQGTITDIDGSFSLTSTIPLPWNLDISYTGYTTQSITVDDPSDPLNIRMEPSSFLAQEVVISASRKREKVQEAPASISVFSDRKLAASPNDNPVRSLISAPGVNIQQASAGRINIHLRGDAGLFASSSFPMLDYRALVGAGTGTFDALNTPLNNIDIERIEVVRGPGSALYGPGVTSGVIHFLSKSAIDKPGTTIQVKGGELSTYGASIRHATKVSDKFGFKINATYTRGGEFTLDPNDPEDAARIALFRNEVVSPAISGGVVDPTQQGTVLLTREDLDPDGDGNPLQDFYRHFAANANLEFRPQDDLSINLAGGLNNASGIFFNNQGEGLAQSTDTWVQARMQKGGLFAQFFVTANNGGTEENPAFLYQTGNRTLNERTQIEGQLQYNFDIPSILNSNWTAGFDYRRSNANTQNTIYGRNENDDSFSIAGLYLQGKFGITEKLDLILAARGDRFNSLEENGFSPRAALVYKAAPNHTFRTSYNRAIASPSQLNLNIDFPLATIVPGAYDIWLVGNRNEQIFGDNPMITFNGAIPFPSLPVGTPGLPLGVVQGAVTQQAGQQILAGVGAQLAMLNPAFAGLIPGINEFLTNPANFASGTTGNFVAFDLLARQPFGPLNGAPQASLRKEDTWEFGYVGLIADKLRVSFDLYNRKIDGEAIVSAISPSFGLQGLDMIGSDLGAGVAAMLTPFLIQQLTPLAPALPAPVEQIAAQIAGAYAMGYAQAGDAFAQGIAPLANGFILGTVQTQSVPDNGVTHVAAGYRTFESYSYTGMDLGLEYFVNSDLSIFGNYSYISENMFTPGIKGVEGSASLRALSIPKNKYRLGANYGPIMGWRANLSFQHDDSFESLDGQFSGTTDERNVVDLGIGYKFENGLTINLSSQNLFDSEYRAFPGMPKIGRRSMVTLTYDFANK